MEELRRIQPPTGETHRRKEDFSWKSIILWSVLLATLLGLTIVVTLVAVGVIKPQRLWENFKAKTGTKKGGMTRIEDKNASDYWAVFLVNNQVYFGKLVTQNEGYLGLQDVFYLRAQRQLQPSEEEREPSKQQQVQLIKLGSELHGPVDEIQFNQENVLFIERLKKDSRVVVGIEQYKKEGTGTLGE